MFCYNSVFCFRKLISLTEFQEMHTSIIYSGNLFTTKVTFGGCASNFVPAWKFTLRNTYILKVNCLAEDFLYPLAKVHNSKHKLVFSDHHILVKIVLANKWTTFSRRSWSVEIKYTHWMKSLHMQVFSDLKSNSPYSVEKRENTDWDKLRIRTIFTHFLF